MITLLIAFLVWGSVELSRVKPNVKTTKAIHEFAAEFEDDKNAVIAISDRDDVTYYDYFYEEFDNRIIIQQSMNMIFFGPPTSFLRLDAETVLHVLMHTKKHLIPKTRALLAWDILTDGKTAAFLRRREYLAFGHLLNAVPEEDLYYVNFGDPAVLRFFASNKDLLNRKYGILISAYQRYFGNVWYKNATYINELGYLTCGFPSHELKKISPKVFIDINVEVISKLTKCRPDQVETLYQIAVHPKAYDAPYKWSAYEISRIGNLFICIPKYDIGSLKLEAIQAIPNYVMEHIDQRKLLYFTVEQIHSMNQFARRTYFLRLQLLKSIDVNSIINSKGWKIKPHLGLPISLFLVIKNLSY